MKRWVWLFLALLLIGCDGGLYSGTLIYEGAHTFGPGTRLPGDVFVRAGTVEFATGSGVAGSVSMLGGTLTINGQVDGDLALLGGRLILGPQAEIGGDLRLGGGEVERSETTVIHGQTITGSGIEIPQAALDQERSWDDWLRRLSAALLLAGLGALLAHGKPQPLAGMGEAIVDHALVSGAVGLLVLLVLPALLVMMAFTVLLIPVVMAIGLLLLLLLGVGLTAVGYQIGLWTARRLGRDVAPAAAAFGGTLLLLVCFEIPYVGGGLLVGTAVLVLGAGLLTRWGLRPYTPEIPPTGPTELASYARPSQKKES